MTDGIDADYIEHVRSQLALARKYAVSPMPGRDVKFAMGKIEPESLNKAIEDRLQAQLDKMFKEKK